MFALVCLHKYVTNAYNKLLSLNKILIRAFFLCNVKLSNLYILPSFPPCPFLFGLQLHFTGQGEPAAMLGALTILSETL
jgi:hypothetical protein